MTQSMRIRRPTWHDAYDAQVGLWRWYGTPAGLDFLQTGYEINSQPLSENSRELLFKLYQSEPGRILSADPIFVSAEMCDVIDAAHSTFEPEPIFETDWLTQFGFVWYENPFVIPDRFDNPLVFRGFSWCPMIASPSVSDEGERMAGDGVVVTIYADIDHPTVPLGFAPSHVTPWWFGMTFEGNEVDENERPTGAGWWWRIAQVTLRLMQQRIAVRHNETPSRPQRREAKRFDFNDRDVLVVRLRREKGEHHDPMGEGANYSHRFIVGGHWRNQWFPASSVHRQIWIGAYVKGPEDKPLVVNPQRAFTLHR